MATPTPPNPMKPNPSQQGRTPSGIPGATPPVSTPFSASYAHAAFSPRGPKSSPQQFKKSPATSTTLMGHPGNGALNFDSPSAAAAMGALGMGGGLDIGLGNVGGLGGLGSLGTEDERVKRLDAILEVLGKPNGRVSEAGLERLSQRIGLNKMWEEHRTPDGRTTKTLVIAGHGLQLDINLDNNIVQGVTLAFPESDSVPNVMKHVGRAEKILLKDLQLLPNQSPLTKTLDKFAHNLERQALLDKLSIFPGLDCQEAIAGIHESLDKLHKWELQKTREDPAMSGKPDRLLNAAVMCTKSGQPAMHAREHVGLSIDYWTDYRLIPFSESSDEDQIWSVLVGCKALNGELYQPIRVSEKWISPNIEKAEPSPEELLTAGSNTPLLDWLEPEPTILPSNPDSKVVGVDVVQPDGTMQKFPNVKFTATLSPPVIVPQSVCNTLYSVIGAEAPPMLLPAYTFDNISFPIPEGIQHDASELRTITCQRDVMVMSSGEMVTRSHENTLFVYKPVYGQIITELPFSHPRQIVAMLPTLRQYAFISRLLSRSFASTITGEATEKKDPSITSRTTTTREEEFRGFMTGGRSYEAPETSNAPLRLDVVLSVHPTAGLNIVFPFRDSTANLELQIQPNAVVHVVSQNVLPEDQEIKGPQDNDKTDRGAEDENAARRKRMKPQDLGRALEMFEDLGKWAEWIRTRLC